MQPPPDFDARYTKLQWLGKGGFGVVYRAYDARLDRDVAIKLLNPEFAADPLWRQRFRQEATAASRLSHPNITIVYDRSEEGNQLYIVMEFVEGKPLSSFIRDRIPLTDPERLLLLEQLCDGLQFAHQRQIIHRDIKPENLIVRDEPDGSRTLKILDFGIAKIVNTNQTTDGLLRCTPSYVSPELINNDPVDHRSDIFAVGAVAYELLVLEKAFNFSATNQYSLQTEMRHKIVEQPHRPMQAVRPGIDPELGEIVDRALAKDVAQRYRDLGEMRLRLRRVRERLEATVSGETVVLKAPEQHLLKQVNQFVREGNLTAAINLLETDLPFAPSPGVRTLLEERLAHVRRAREEQTQAVTEAIAAATAAFQEGEETVALRVLERFQPRALVEAPLAELRRAAAAISTAVQVVADAPKAARDAALDELQKFAPAHLVEGAIRRLRARAAERAAEEERIRLDAIRAIAQAEIAFEAGGLDESIATLARFQPAALVAPALDTLRAAAALIRRTREAVQEGARDARDRALEELAGFEPGELVASALDRLRAVAADRDAGEQRAREEAAAARAAVVIAAARDAFRRQDRAGAITALQQFDDPPRVEAALALLRDAAATIERAVAAVRSADRSERASTLDAVETFSDPDLVSAPLAELRALDARRTADEDHAQAARELVASVREQFDHGDRTGALQRLVLFAPAHAIVAAEIVALRDRAAQLARAERDRRAADSVIAAARAEFSQGRKEAAIRSLESHVNRTLVVDALEELRRAEALIVRAETQVAQGDAETRSATLRDLERFEPSVLVSTVLQTLRARSAQRDAEEREIQQARARAAAKEAARAIVQQAYELFVAGKRADAVRRIERFEQPELVREPLFEIKRLAALADRADSSVRVGSPEQRRAALAELAAAEPAAALERTLSVLRQVDAERSAEESRLEAQARGAAAVTRAHALFDGGAHDEAIALLEQHAPVAAVVTAALADLLTKRAQIAEALAHAEAMKDAGALVAHARALFVGGQVEDALAALAHFQPRELVAGELDALGRAARAIELARTAVETGAAPERRTVIETLSRQTPPNLFERALEELRRLDAARTTQEAQLEAARLIAEAELEAARLAAEAESTARAAHAEFVAGNYDKAIANLERFRPSGLVQAALQELQTARRDIEHARAVVSAEDDEARQVALDRLESVGPPALVGGALEQLRGEHLARRAAEAQAQREREHANAAQRAIEDAQLAVDAGELQTALLLLERFTPPHPMVTERLTALQRGVQVEALNARAAQALEAGDLPAAKAALAEARGLVPDDSTTVELRRRLDGELRSVRLQRARTLAVRVVGPGVLAALIGIAGYVYWPRLSDGTDPPRVEPTATVDSAQPSGPTAAAPTDPGRDAAPVTPDPVRPPDTGPEKPDATSDPSDATPAREKQLQDYRTTAQQQFATGQTRQALSTIDRALGLNSNDTESRRLRDTFNKVEQAAAAAGAARQEAVNAEAPKRAPAVFADGDRLERAARADRTGRRLDDALKDYAAAREAFSKAARDATDAAAAEAAARTRPEPPVKPESKPLVVPPGSGAVATLPGTVTSAPAVPEVFKPADKSPTKAPVAPVVDDRAAIKSVLRAYESAMAAKDFAALQRVQSVSGSAAESLKNLFNRARSLEVRVLAQDSDIEIQGQQARVTCGVSRNYVMRDQGARTNRTDRVTFTLQKRPDGSWIIASVQ